MTRPILYISGPYSAGNGRTVADNIAIARSYAVAAARRGWLPFTPHLNTAHFEVDCPEVPNEDWIDGDLAILRLLPRARAAVLLLPGWEQSKGARLERDWAIHLNLEVFDPPATPWDIPPASIYGECRYYRQVHYECDSRDTCSRSRHRDRCPSGATCPIRRRCR